MRVIGFKFLHLFTTDLRTTKGNAQVPSETLRSTPQTENHCSRLLYHSLRIRTTHTLPSRYLVMTMRMKALYESPLRMYCGQYFPSTAWRRQPSQRGRQGARCVRQDAFQEDPGERDFGCAWCWTWAEPPTAPPPWAPWGPESHSTGRRQWDA